MSSVHRVSILDARGFRHRLVVRRYMGADQREWGVSAVRREAAILSALERSGLPAPRLVHADPDGVRTQVPAIVMSRVPGRIHLTPSDPDSWLRQMAALLPRIHALSIEGSPFKSFVEASQLAPPPGARDVVIWRRAAISFRHGPADVDVAHCRLNLTILFSASFAERLRLAYEAEAGRSLDPWWDIAGLMRYSQEWKTFIPLQVGNRRPVDIGGMDARMDNILEAALRRAA